MKRCAMDGCTNEIQAWQTYCPQHYQMLMQQQSGGSVVEQPPTVPATKVAMPQKMTPTSSPQELPKFSPPQKQIGSKSEGGDVVDKDKLVRKECLKCAVDLMIATDELNKPYEELIGQIATLVEDFNKIVSGTFKK